MKIYMILIGLVVCGCVSQPTELTQEESDLDVYYEKPNIDFEDLGRIVVTSQGGFAKDALKKTLGRAAELGADAIIIHFSGNIKIPKERGPLTAYRIEATAMRYIQ